MITRCANAACSREFRYLHQGAVFCLKSNGKEHKSTSRVNFAGQVDGVQYAWLCDECAARFEVVVDSNDNLKVRSRYRVSGIVASIGAAIGLQLLYAAAWAGDACSVCDLIA